MSDLAKFYPTEVHRFKTEPFIKECINTLKTFNKNQ
jgi:hypothetical protein